MAAAFLFTRTTSQSPRLRETLVTVAITNRHCVPKMRTRAKMRIVASDRARRENVPRHILFYSWLRKLTVPVAGSMESTIARDSKW